MTPSRIRGALTFRQSDVTRAVKAVVAAGVEVVRVEVDRQGRISVIAGKPSGQSGDEPPSNEWDEIINDKNSTAVRPGVS
jgi:hypothetical protein